MTEREDDSQPRKRIAVACGRCRKRKIRCSGDPGHGNPCSNCKNAGHEPCLFLRVSSTETQLRDGDASNGFGYNMETARAYQSRGAVSPLNPVSQYAADMPTGDVMAYRQSTYPYGNKSYYTSVAGWDGAYADDGVGYAMNYPSYTQHMSQDPVHMVQGYRYGSSSKSVYVDPETSSYPYPNLVHRPAAVSSDLPNFSLSGMAASLPTSDRLPNVNRTLTSSAYRSDGLPGPPYSSSKAASAQSADAYSSLNSSFESPVSYATTASLPSSRTASQSEAAGYHSAATSTSSAEGVYGPPSDHHPYRSGHDDDYIYSENRRVSLPNGATTPANSVLPNGQVYAPDPAHSQPHVAPPASQGYVASNVSGAEAATAATSRTTSDGHRRSAGSLRGA